MLLSHRGVIVGTLAVLLLPECHGSSGSHASGGMGARDAATDGGAGSGGSTSAGGTGAGATGGAAGGFSGAQPRWTPLGTVATCAVDRLQNPSELRAFTWTPCSGLTGCEDATLNRSLGGNYVSASAIATEDEQVVVMLGFSGLPQFMYFTDENGGVKDGYRIQGGSGDSLCLASGSIWKDRYFVFASPGNVGSFGGVLGSLASSSQPAYFTLASPPSGSPNGFALGDNRLVWDFAPPVQSLSTASSNGSDSRVFAGRDMEIATALGPERISDMGLSVAAGPSFVTGMEMNDGGYGRLIVGESDGVAAVTAYVDPADGTDADGAAFAAPYIAWQRGVGRPDPSRFQYNSVELWASLYDPDPAKLVPERVGVLRSELSGIGGGVGGWGRYAIVAGAAGVATGVDIWNIPTRTSKQYRFAQSERPVILTGLTKRHLWATSKLAPRYVMRFAVE